MNEIPMEWIDKLFECMQLFYGKRWTSKFDKIGALDRSKIMWRKGLTGLTHDKIKGALLSFKNHAKHDDTKPPNVIEFFMAAEKIANFKIKTYDGI